MQWLKNWSWKNHDGLQMMEMAANVGLERRMHFRISYPERGAIGELPTLTFAGHPLRIVNISTGGCCVLDPQEVLGPAVGEKVSLNLHWPTDSQHVVCRIVSRVDNRRHIQFMDISEKNQGRIRQHLEPAYRGNALRKVDSGDGSRMTLEACEIWVSTLEDGITLFDHPHLLASLLFRREDFLCYRDALPVKGKERKHSVMPEIFEALILFLANVPNASSYLQTLTNSLSELGQDRFR